MTVFDIKVEIQNMYSFEEIKKALVKSFKDE